MMKKMVLQCDCKKQKCSAPLPFMHSSKRASVSTSNIKGLLDAHNVLRADHVDTQPLEWDDELQRYAQAYVNECKSKKSKDAPNGCFMKHNPENKKYGENLAWIRTYEDQWKKPEKIPETELPDVVQGWYDERFWYEKNGNRFVDHKEAKCLDDNICCLGSRQTGHYTQVVSKSSKKMGCAVGVCVWTDKDNTKVKDELWVCNYDPSGNFKTCKKDKWEADGTCKKENLYFMDEFIPPGKSQDWNAPKWMLNQDKLVSMKDYFIVED